MEPDASPEIQIQIDDDTQDYEKTLDKWRARSSKMAYVYDFIGERYRNKANIFGVIAFVLTSMTSLLGLGVLGINGTSYPTADTVLKGLSAFLAVLSAIFTGVPRLLGWSSMVDACQKYLDSVEHFLASIISEQSLPLKYRTDPEQYIMAEKDRFQAILNSAPLVPQDDYADALDAHDQNISMLRRDLVR